MTQRRRTPARRRRPPAGLATPRFAWANPPLGTGRLAGLGVGPKAAMLDRAAAAGLPVPRGVVILDGHHCPSPRALGLRDPLVVRSAFSAEDGADESLAGWFESRLGVTVATLEAAVAEVRASAARRPGRFRTDVLVMEQVPARHAGVAAIEGEHRHDVVNVVEGLGDRLLAGEVPGERLLVARLERWERPDRTRWRDRPWVPRLQRLLRAVRTVFGAGDWDVEWADDGATCWLVQVRPLTRPVRRDETLTVANHAEIFPPLPSPFMTSLIDRCSAELFGWYRAIDPSLPGHRRFIEVVAGRPFINLSLLEDMLASWGLPTRLVAEGFGGRPASDEPLRPARLLRRSPVLARLGLAQVAAVAGARRRERRAAAVGAGGAGSFSEAVAQLADAYVGLVTGMFPLSSASGPPIAVLRRAGTLAEHAGAHRTVTTELAEALEALAGADEAALADFLARFGHRGVYESDIARPRYADDPTPLRAVMARPRHPDRPTVPRDRPRRTVRGRLTLPVWWAARPVVDARERLRHEAMRGFATVRASLVALAERAVAGGALPSVDHLWLLRVHEAERLDAGWVPEPAFWDARRAELAELAALDPPALVHRDDDPADWAPETAPDAGRLHGLGLTEGTVRGRAWVLAEPATRLPDGFDPATTVLVARSVDAGWIPTFALVAAVAVETGGDLSHGSILLRERGIPAATNVRGATRAVRTGDPVELRAGPGVLVVLGAAGGAAPDQPSSTEPTFSTSATNSPRSSALRAAS